MKKLLGILGSIGLVSSWTTLVVACGGNSTVTKIDLAIFNLKLGAFENKPTPEEIIDEFNAKNDSSLIFILNTDVTVENITDTSATINANPDSPLYTGSTNVTFTIKIDLNTYEKKELTTKDNDPKADEILNLFNKANETDLFLKTDVTIKVFDDQAKIEATPESQKVKGSIIVKHSNKIFLGNINTEPFNYLETKPDADEVVEIINEANPGLELKIGIDITLSNISTYVIITAIEYEANKVTGSIKIEFGYKKNLAEYSIGGIVDLGAQDKEPKKQDIFDQFILKHVDLQKLELELDKDIIIEPIGENEAIIKAHPTSKKVYNQVTAKFTIKLNLKAYKETKLKAFDKAPSDQEILDDFNLKNPTQPNLNLVTDVTVTNKTAIGATIEANPNSSEYIGSAEVDFTIKLNLIAYTQTTLKAFDKAPIDQEVLDEFNAKNPTQPKLILKTDVTVTNITSTGATIIANPNSILYTGSTNVFFNIKTNLKTYTQTTLKAFDKAPTDQEVLDEFNLKNSSLTPLNLKNDVSITEKNPTGATIKAKPDSTLYIDSVPVKFTIKLNLDVYTQTKLKVFDKEPIDQEILDEFNKLNPTQPNLILKTDVTITNITATGAIITANPSSTLYTGFANVSFTVKLNLKAYTQTELKAFDKIPPSDKEIIDRFNLLNPSQPNLTLNTDVTIIKKNLDGAKIIANPNSILYIGSTDVTFGLKINIESLIINKENWEIKDKKPETILTELQKQNSDLDITIMKVDDDSITETGATIIPANKETHMGSVEIKFQILPYPYDKKTWYIDKDNKHASALNSRDIPSDTTEVIQIGYIDYNNVKSAHKMPKSITKVPNIINKNIKSLNGLFWEATNFNQDISSWDLSNVTIISDLFYGASSFNNGGKPLTWGEGTKNITKMGGIFSGAKNFNQDISNWNVSNVTDMSSMFIGAKKFNQPLNDWNVSKVNNMRSMFGAASEFNQPLFKWIVSNVSSMEMMFSGASNFDQDLNSWAPRRGASNWDFAKNAKFEHDTDKHPRWT